MATQRPLARAVAFHLPQFHPTPENDRWWGAGFTEWTNVAKSRPVYPGHRQPVLPAELGFYDLRLAEAREAQARLATAAGIEAFCYWHYWFGGKRLLERPVEAILDLGKPDMPFCLAWANESWSRRWLGEERDVLVAQEYSAADDAAHAKHLASVFADKRYLKVSGRPAFLVYRPTFHDDIQRFIVSLRDACQAQGLREPFLIAINAHARAADYTALGFDETLDFQPQLGALPGALGDNLSFNRIVRNLRQGALTARARVYDEEAARALFAATRPSSARVPCVFVAWDNSPRRGRNATVIRSRGVDSFRRALARAVDGVQARPIDERLVFINAWNEWAEGNHLEPDDQNGSAYLDTVRAILGPAAT